MEKLIQSKVCGWKDLSQEEKNVVFSFNDGYINFLNVAKTEREAVKTVVEIAEKNGYKKYDDSKKYKAGDKFPAPTQGDVYVYGDYEYRYNRERDFVGGDAPYFNADLNGWSVVALDITKETYGSILHSINGKNVVSMQSTFIECSNLISSPEIPNTIVDAIYAYGGCTSLKTAPIIPQGVEKIDGMFEGCSALTTVIAIPESVKSMVYCFSYCRELTGEIEININITDSHNYNSCFCETTKPIKITGSCSNETKTKLAATANYGNVTY